MQKFLYYPAPIPAVKQREAGYTINRSPGYRSIHKHAIGPKTNLEASVNLTCMSSVWDVGGSRCNRRKPTQGGERTNATQKGPRIRSILTVFSPVISNFIRKKKEKWMVKMKLKKVSVTILCIVCFVFTWIPVFTPAWVFPVLLWRVWFPCVSVCVYLHLWLPALTLYVGPAMFLNTELNNVRPCSV